MAKFEIQHFPTICDTYMEQFEVECVIAGGKVLHGIDNPLDIMRDTFSASSAPTLRLSRGVIEVEPRIERYDLKLLPWRRRRQLEGFSRDIKQLVLSSEFVTSTGLEILGGRVLDLTTLVMYPTMIAEGGWTEENDDQLALKRDEATGMYVINHDYSTKSPFGFGEPM